MILTKKVSVVINKWNIQHLTDLGYENLVQNHKLTIPVKHLQNGSGIRIDCKCDICDSDNNIQYCKYIVNHNRSGFYGCKACNNVTLKMSLNKLYGVDNVAHMDICIEKKKQTCLKKYGFEYAVQSDIVISNIEKTFELKYGGHPMKTDLKFKGVEKSTATKAMRGLIIPEEKLELFDIYRKKVRKLTERNRPLLFEIWDGTDYYDGEYIKNNFTFKHTDPYFPTLDHKTSIYFGFTNNISVEDIAIIDNLCITKRKHNSIKNSLIEKQYRTLLGIKKAL